MVRTMTFEKMIERINDNRYPFIDHSFENITIRYFNKKYPKYLFKWHYDEENRIVEVLNETDWKFQFDNKIPIILSKGQQVKIPKGAIHRVIPGCKPLTVKIIKK
tara:strand:+ start:20185 stop:20499 length:315 start_codon:yes stop_codon:yes gene_type:complete